MDILADSLSTNTYSEGSKSNNKKNKNMKKYTLLVGILLAYQFACSQSGSLINNPNFTMVWNEEFNGNSLNTTRWSIRNSNLVSGNKVDTSYPSNHLENVRVLNGWLMLTTTKRNNFYRVGNISCQIPNTNQLIYEVNARFKNGYNATPQAWFYSGNGDCPAFNFAQYQEIDILEFYGDKQKSTGGVHGCKCVCADNDALCRSTQACRETLRNNDEYSLLFKNTEEPQIYYSRWTTSRGIWIGQNYVPLSFRNTPSNYQTNHPGKVFELGTTTPKCVDWQATENCTSLPMWFQIDYVRFFQPILDCQTIVNEIPNFATYAFGIKNRINISGATTIPNNNNIYLYATNQINLNNGLNIPLNTNLELGIFECR